LAAGSTLPLVGRHAVVFESFGSVAKTSERLEGEPVPMQDGGGEERSDSVHEPFTIHNTDKDSNRVIEQGSS
jgi:hypothetical protein